MLNSTPPLPALTLPALLSITSAFSNMAYAANDTIVESCWEQTFTDDFNTLDYWNPQTNTGQWRTRYIWERDTIINNELQYYIDPIEHGMSPFSIDDGILKITASKTPAHLKAKTKNQPYVSGVLTSENGFSQQYGRFEVRAKPPKGKGLWSAFWLLPSFDQWPQGVAVLPEIDVMEHLGHEPRTFHTTLHTNQAGKLDSYPYDHTLKSDLTKDFHIYSVVWNAESVNWYLDYQKVASHPTPADFTRPVHFLLNLAVGGSWPGSPNRNTKLPASFDIDYVRAYKLAELCN